MGKKYIYITYSEFASLALVIQHANFMPVLCCPLRHVWLYHLFSTLSRKQHLKLEFRSFLQLLCETSVSVRRSQPNITNVHRVFVKATHYSCQILMRLDYSQQIFEKRHTYKFSWKSVQWEQICSLWRYRQT